MRPTRTGCDFSIALRTGFLLFILPWTLGSGPAQQGPGQDDKILERGENLLEEAKAAYEDARSKSSVATFVDAGFKLEEARIKFIVLQEIGSPEKQKLAGDRLRAINQLGKLIHDGKVAISGSPAESPNPTPADPANPLTKEPGATPDPAPAMPAIDVMKRWPVPEVGKQRDAERLIKDLFKDQYAKKTVADRQALIKALFEQAAKTTGDPNALWVLYREVQDTAIQICDAKAVSAAIEAASRMFDVDALSMKSTAYQAAGKNAKTIGEFATLTEALLKLVDELIAVDQYDSADKAMTAALQNAKRTNDAGLIVMTTTRSKELVEAKSKYAAMKSALVILAKNPDDPGANTQMGQYLCFVKGSWDLGLRFIAKGSDATLKPIAEKELSLTLQLADQIALADSWSEIATKEKSPLGKSQLLAHAKAIYQKALPESTGLERAKIEKRLEQLDTAESTGGAKPQDLMPLIDTAKDALNGTWSLSGGTLSVQAGQYARLEIPYEPPAEYDFSIVFLRKAGNDDVVQHLSRSQKGFAFHMQYIGSGYGFISETHHDEAAVVVKKGPLENNKRHTSVVKVRRDNISAYLDGKLITEWKPTENDLGTYHSWSFKKESALGLGSFSNVVEFYKVEITEISGKGKRLR